MKPGTYDLQYPIKPVPCAHIADYYQEQWKRRKSIGSNLLRHGYRQFAVGSITKPFNNLYRTART